MKTITGKYNTATVFATTVEDSCMKQIKELCDEPWTQGSKIKIQADCHSGKGCVIGTTMTITDKIVPNLVGVDIGCLDQDSEFLSPEGWVKINNWNGEQVLQFDKENMKASFVCPTAYIKLPCDEFYHFFSKYGLDEMVSEEHKVMAMIGTKGRGHRITDYVAKDFVLKHNSLKKGINGGVLTTFALDQNGIVGVTENDIRIKAMISADATIRNESNGKKRIELHFSKQRKIERAKFLLSSSKIEFNEYKAKDGTTSICFYINGEFFSKDLGVFWKANSEQLRILLDECWNWDGNKGRHNSYFTTSKENADVIQFAASTQNIRCGIQTHKYLKTNWKTSYLVYTTKNNIVRFTPQKINTVKSKDGYKYCFTVSSGYFIMRRNDKISITGNCGILTTKFRCLSLDFKKLDETIKSLIPLGMNIHNVAVEDFTSELNDLWSSKAAFNFDKVNRSLGSLGQGNHFISIEKDEDDCFYLLIHTGSRNFGKVMAEYYQDKAIQYHKSQKGLSKQEVIADLKAKGLQHTIPEVLKNMKPEIGDDFCYLEGVLFDSYIHDMKIAQAFASLNRKTIAQIICEKMGICPIEMFQTVHNYIDTENMILRKGSISAQAGEKCLIPINMRDGSLICVGKGNADYNYSAPHGAGRLMSRNEAKKKLNLKDFQDTMKDVYSTTVNASTLDEAPDAYKPMNEILANIKDTVDIVTRIKPVFNIKASD